MSEPSQQPARGRLSGWSPSVGGGVPPHPPGPRQTFGRRGIGGFGPVWGKSGKIDKNAVYGGFGGFGGFVENALLILGCFYENGKKCRKWPFWTQNGHFGHKMAILAKMGTLTPSGPITISPRGLIGGFRGFCRKWRFWPEMRDWWCFAVSDSKTALFRRPPGRNPLQTP